LQVGDQLGAAEHFTKALTLAPDMMYRPIAAYYLEKLGKPVPPGREAAGVTKPGTVDAKGTGAGASTGATPVLPTPPPREAAG
jgi:hypothetical protein